MKVTEKRNKPNGDKKAGNLLAIDTSTASLTVALTRGEEHMGIHSSLAERNHSRYLVPAMESLLASLQMTPRQLDAIAVGVGPGSYTGVRIGTSVAKTVAWSLNIPIYTVSSLEALALGAQSSSGDNHVMELTWVIPLVDARRGQAFTALYSFLNEGNSLHWECHVEDGIRSIQVWLEELRMLLQEKDRLNEALPARILFAGEIEKCIQDEEALKSSLQPFNKQGSVQLLEHELDAYSIAQLAWKKQQKDESAEVHHVVPNYTQLPEAEVKLLSKLAGQ